MMEEIKKMKRLSDIEDSKCYPEDYKGENGEYMNQCPKCKDWFVGHKRRIFCKECINPTE
jgi:hypothetical protein